MLIAIKYLFVKINSFKKNFIKKKRGEIESFYNKIFDINFYSILIYLL